MELKYKTESELKQDCKKLKIGGYSKLNKLDLVKLIKKNQKGGSWLNNLKVAVDENIIKKQLEIWNKGGNPKRINELCNNIVIQKEKNVNKILNEILKINAYNTNNENNNTNLNPFFLNSIIGNNKKKDTLLTIAVEYNNLPAVKKIIKILKKSKNPFNIDEHIIDKNIVFNCYSEEIYKELLTCYNDTNINKINQFNQTILMDARKKYMADVIPIIFQKNPNINLKDKFGQTALEILINRIDDIYEKVSESSSRAIVQTNKIEAQKRTLKKFYECLYEWYDTNTHKDELKAIEIRNLEEYYYIPGRFPYNEILNKIKYLKEYPSRPRIL